MKPAATFVLSFACALAVWAQETAPEVFRTEVPVREGEICIGCNHPVGRGDKTYLVEGQRVPVHSGHCDDALRGEPMNFLARLKPRGGWFGGESASTGEVANGWLLAGLYAILGLCFAAVSAHTALNRGHSPVLWFFAGLVLTAPGYLLLLMRPARAQKVPAGLVKIPATAEPSACPACGATNHPSAAQCLECGAALRPVVLSEVSRLKSTLN